MRLFSWKTGLPVLALVMAIGWAIASPYMTLLGLRNAIENNDAQAISQAIDFPELRESIRTQLLAHADTVTGGTGNTRDLGTAMVVGMALSYLDQYVSTEGVVMAMNMRAQQEARKSTQPNAAPQASIDGMPTEWSMARTGITTFEVRIEDSKAAGVAALFALDGLSWKLSGLSIPESTFAQLR